MIKIFNFILFHCCRSFHSLIVKLLKKFKVNPAMEQFLNFYY